MKLQKLGQPEGEENDRDDWFFWCEGCEMRHMIRSKGPRPCWQFNGDVDHPTFSPSYLIIGMEGILRCHSFIENGFIRYLDDCEHPLKNQTVELKEFETWRDE